MSTFSWLIIGHLVGDWLLQNDWMARGKKDALITAAGLSHFAIYTAAILGTYWLAGVRIEAPAIYVGLGLIVFVSHWLIDATTIVERWIRFYRQSDIALMRIMVDQTLHLLVLTGLVVIIDKL